MSLMEAPKDRKKLSFYKYEQMFQLTPEIRPHSAVLGAVSAAEGRRAAAVGGGEEGGGEATREHEAFRRGKGEDTAGNMKEGRNAEETEKERKEEIRFARLPACVPHCSCAN